MIGRAGTAEDFAAVARLMRDLRALDEAESAKLGAPPEAVAVFYANRTAEALAARFLSADAAMFVLRDGSGAVTGCGGLVEDGAGIAELRHVYLDPASRGQGLGAALVARLIEEARARGMHEVRLETAVFLTTAIALYRRMGFSDLAPFAPVPPGLEGLSVFMTLRLWTADPADPP